MIEEIVENNLRINEQIQNLKRERKCEYCGSNEYYASGLCRKCYARRQYKGTCEYKPRIYKPRVKAKKAEPPKIVPQWRQAVAFDAIRESFDPPEDFEQSIDYVLSTMLSGRTAKMLQMRYELLMKYSEIAEEFGLSRERVRQIIGKGLSDLRRPIRKKYIVYGIKGIGRMEEEAAKARLVTYKGDNLSDFLEQHGEENIDLLEINTRAYNCLMRSGIKTISSLWETIRDGKLKHIVNIGDRTSENIRQAFDKYLTEVI